MIAFTRVPSRAIAACVGCALSLLPAAIAAAPCHGPAPAAANVSVAALQAEVDELRRLGGPRKTNFVPAGETYRYGRAEIVIDAPVDEVLRQVRSYANYKDLAPNKFRQSRVVDRDGESADVYMQVPLVGGLVVLWQVMRFGPPIQRDLITTVVDGRFVRGNIKTSRVTFIAKRFDRQTTLLECDLLIALDFPAPEENINEELRDAAGDALVGVREKAQNQYRARLAAGRVASPVPVPSAPAPAAGPAAGPAAVAPAAVAPGR